ncbi:MAG TPA: helix-turn-helix transcriptional regulator [Alphaproteobacteria bacterium]|jgi:transcriptional regulator with XRE-family HTH domain|nr:helix-turn-helix transcriptional regulator [Alphaproteobacteria bacterium]
MKNYLPPLQKILSQNLRRKRKLLRLSQEELAYICGLHRTYIGSVERGERNITLSTLETLAGALQTSAVDLLTFYES